MKKTKWLLVALTVGMIVTAGIGQALAYFTTYAEAQGGYPIYLGDRTEITENFRDWTKIVTIHNEADSAEPVWIRVIAYSAYPMTFTGTDWEPGADGYYYYANPVNAGGDTSSLEIKIHDKDDAGKNPEKPDEDSPKKDFNVIVIYESTPVRYGENGELLAADWNELLDTGTTEGGKTE